MGYILEMGDLVGEGMTYVTVGITFVYVYGIMSISCDVCHESNAESWAVDTTL